VQNPCSFFGGAAGAMLPDADLLYAAVAERNADYEGVFFVGVRTTGVFCRPLSLPGEASEVVRRLVDAVERDRR
jgi:AraC family transcriptional regulator of adaptative response/methylated-DNA-[protein]-cysteine methyltransferase